MAWERGLARDVGLPEHGCSSVERISVDARSTGLERERLPEATLILDPESAGNSRVYDHFITAL